MCPTHLGTVGVHTCAQPLLVVGGCDARAQPRSARRVCTGAPPLSAHEEFEAFASPPCPHQWVRGSPLKEGVVMSLLNVMLHEWFFSHSQLKKHIS